MILIFIGGQPEVRILGARRGEKTLRTARRRRYGPRKNTEVHK